MIDPVPPEDGGGFPGDGGGFPGDGGTGRVFSPGWDRSAEPAGLIIKWRDDNGLWSKEHVIGLGAPGDDTFPALLGCRGNYSTRQWEVVMMDRAPLVLAYVEEDVEVFDE